MSQSISSNALNDSEGLMINATFPSMNPETFVDKNLFESIYISGGEEGDQYSVQLSDEGETILDGIYNSTGALALALLSLNYSLSCDSPSQKVFDLNVNTTRSSQILLQNFYLKAPIINELLEINVLGYYIKDFVSNQLILSGHSNYPLLSSYDLDNCHVGITQENQAFIAKFVCLEGYGNSTLKSRCSEYTYNDYLDRLAILHISFTLFLTFITFNLIFSLVCSYTSSYLASLKREWLAYRCAVFDQETLYYLKKFFSPSYRSVQESDYEQLPMEIWIAIISFLDDPKDHQELMGASRTMFAIVLLNLVENQSMDQEVRLKIIPGFFGNFHKNVSFEPRFFSTRIGLWFLWNKRPSFVFFFSIIFSAIQSVISRDPSQVALYVPFVFNIIDFVTQGFRKREADPNLREQFFYKLRNRLINQPEIVINELKELVKIISSQLSGNNEEKCFLEENNMYSPLLNSNPSKKNGDYLSINLGPSQKDQ